LAAAVWSLACRPASVGRNETLKSPFVHFSTVISETYWLAPQYGVPSGARAGSGVDRGVSEAEAAAPDGLPVAFEALVDAA